MTGMRVAQLLEQGKPLKVTTIEKPTPGPKEVLVKVEAACLVPNSVNVIAKGPGHHYTLPELPCVFGLDAAGVIEAVGENVIGLKAGDRVYVDPHISCGNCKRCRKGKSGGIPRIDLFLLTKCREEGFMRPRMPACVLRY